MLIVDKKSKLLSASSRIYDFGCFFHQKIAITVPCPILLKDIEKIDILVKKNDTFSKWATFRANNHCKTHIDQCLVGLEHHALVLFFFEIFKRLRLSHFLKCSIQKRLSEKNNLTFRRQKAPYIYSPFFVTDAQHCNTFTHFSILKAKRAIHSRISGIKMQKP